MDDPVIMEVRNTVQELPEERFEDGHWEGGSGGRMMVNDLL